MQLTPDGRSARAAADVRLAPLAALVKPEELDALMAFGRGRDEAATASVAAPCCKDARRTVHATIAAAFKGSDTKTVGDAICVKWRPGRKRKRKVAAGDALVVRCVMEKRNAEGFAAVREAERVLGLPRGGVATAGVKDRRAVTWQFATRADRAESESRRRRDVEIPWRRGSRRRRGRDVDGPWRRGARRCDLGRSRDATACRQLARALKSKSAVVAGDARLWPVDVAAAPLAPGQLPGR